MPTSTPTPTDHNSEGDQKCERNTLPADPYEDSHDGSSNATTATMDMDTTPTTETAAELITRMMGAGATGEQIAKALRDKGASEGVHAKPKVDLYASTTTCKYKLCKPIDESTGEEPLFVDAVHLLRTVLDHRVVFLETRYALGSHSRQP